MRNIRSKNTKMELIVRSELHKKGLRFRIHTNLIGKPDIVFPSKKLVIFLDSCFFHKCPYHYVEPKSNQSYWLPKIENNRVRAKKVNKELRNQGWNVMRIWQHQVERDLQHIIKKIINNLNSP